MAAVVAATVAVASHRQRGSGSGSGDSSGGQRAGSWQRNAGRHGHGSRRHRRAATACHCGGDEDTGGDSNGRGTNNNQQLTKSSQRRQVSIGNATPAGMAEATAVLPPHATAMAIKTPTVTAMAGAQTAINNQLKAAMERAEMTAMLNQRQMPWQQRQ